MSTAGSVRSGVSRGGILAPQLAVKKPAHTHIMHGGQQHAYMADLNAGGVRGRLWLLAAPRKKVPNAQDRRDWQQQLPAACCAAR